MGTLGDAFKRALVDQLGEQWWEHNLSVVDAVWTAIEKALAGLNLRYELVRVYQDGLPVSGHELRIVNELARAGSRNHQLLLRMRLRGPTIMGTEAGELLVQEYQLARRLITAAPSAREPGASAGEPALARALLERRDRYIASRINSTLKARETGIIFLGLLHSLNGKLAADIEVVNLFSAEPK
jgi:hypothetical protein